MGKKVEPKQKYSSRIYDWQLDKVPEDESTHDELLHAFQQYYKANLHWIRSGTKRSAQDARYWLNEINKLCVDRRKVILGWIKEIKTDRERDFKPGSKKKRREFYQIQGKIDHKKDN